MLVPKVFFCHLIFLSSLDCACASCLNILYFFSCVFLSVSFYNDNKSLEWWIWWGAGELNTGSGSGLFIASHSVFGFQGGNLIFLPHLLMGEGWSDIKETAFNALPYLSPEWWKCWRYDDVKVHTTVWGMNVALAKKMCFCPYLGDVTWSWEWLWVMPPTMRFGNKGGMEIR